jgi:hypothetical protein
MPRITIAGAALRELRERMARYDGPTVIRITGPMDEDGRAPESLEDAWLLEKLYGPPQRWILHVVPVDETDQFAPDGPGETLHLEELNGLSVGVLTSQTVPRLHIELHRDSIRVFEVEA